MRKRKSNRLKGYDYSRNNLYFVTNCVKNNLCCLGNVIPIGTGHDLSVQVQDCQSHHPRFFNSKSDLPNKGYTVALNQYGLIVQEKINWLMSTYQYVVIHSSVVMPNHFHFIIEIDSQRVKDNAVKIKSLSSLMGALKTTTSKLIHEAGFEDFAWHRSFHDHIIRNDLEFHRISHYIAMNPQKWALNKFYSKV
ncbi:transposase [Flavobacterium sp.]|jgi:putative transposase|uniref:transposase n=1 Tax=Flavobacterium sp. TaxID=239 RepID=UPI0022C970B2|nr:transposase [Flavobacterium sp.]MCZ8144835.1 hypothetical protein [Flavobacterium sp.]MCZ8366751.1 hypothetical protein [Flavobacterium sp.]